MSSIFANVPKSDGHTPSSEDVCWICLDSGSASEPLAQPCSCSSRYVHVNCLARWQLHSAGRSEEKACRFCQAELPDWKPAFSPPVAALPAPVVAVVCRGVTHRFTIEQGPEGKEKFQRQVRQVFGLPPNAEIEVTFTVKAPDSGDSVILRGLQTYEAASYCAAVAASKRMLQTPSDLQTSGPRPHNGPCQPETSGSRRQAFSQIPDYNIGQSSAASAHAPLQRQYAEAIEKSDLSLVWLLRRLRKWGTKWGNNRQSASVELPPSLSRSATN